MFACVFTGQALLEELELSLPFRESALEHIRNRLPDGTIQNILGVAAARSHPGRVLKVPTAMMCLEYLNTECFYCF